MSKPRRRIRRSPSAEPAAPKDGFMDSKAKKDGLFDGIEEAMDMVETSRVDEVVSRYSGRTIPLDDAFPDPPPPIDPNPAMTRAVRHPDGIDVIAGNQPTRSHFDPSEAAESAYREEHQLRFMHRLLMRNANMRQIAAALEIGLAKAMKLRDKLYKRLASEAGSIDMATHAGKTMGFYGEIRGLAMRELEGRSPDIPVSTTDKARFMTIALAAENSMQRFLQASGFYDGSPYRPTMSSIEGDGSDEMALIGNALRAMMDPEVYEREMSNVIDAEYSGYAPGAEDDYKPQVL